MGGPAVGDEGTGSACRAGARSECWSRPGNCTTREVVPPFFAGAACPPPQKAEIREVAWVIATGQSGSAPGSYREGVFQGGKRNWSPPDESVHWRPRVRALPGEFSGGKNAPDYPGVSGRPCLSRTAPAATPGRVGCLVGKPRYY